LSIKLDTMRHADIANHGAGRAHRMACVIDSFINADQKRASFSATPVFAELRQVTTEIEEARQHPILADRIRQDRCFLLSSYASILLAHPMARLMMRTLTWKRTGTQSPVQNENLPASIST
jgi:hypothetical protein